MRTWILPLGLAAGLPAQPGDFLLARRRRLVEQHIPAGETVLLDFGCGLGRHAVFFAKSGFSVSAFDLSREGVARLDEWKEQEGLDIKQAMVEHIRVKNGRVTPPSRNRRQLPPTFRNCRRLQR